MRIGGLQKITLLDYPGKVACTVFLTGCNLRCPYCHNPSLVFPSAEAEQMSEAALFAFLETRRGKLDGVCITGGEPTLQQQLPKLLQNIRRRGFFVKLDTNGTNPSMLRSLINSGLVDYVAMDIKNSPSHYTDTCGRNNIIEQVQESAAFLMKGTVDYEFRTTVCAPLHTPENMIEIGQWLCGVKRYFIQPFVDSGVLAGNSVMPLSAAEIYSLKESVLPYIPNTQIRGQ